MLTIGTVNVIVVSICVSLAFSETWAELGFLCNKMQVCAQQKMPAKLVDDPEPKRQNDDKTVKEEASNQ